jgi:hypothetical protein
MSTRATCVFTVVSETTSSAAISAFDIPRAISLNTSSSRGVSSSSEAGAERWPAPPRENSWIRRLVTEGGASSASP